MLQQRGDMHLAPPTVLTAAYHYLTCPVVFFQNSLTKILQPWQSYNFEHHIEFKSLSLRNVMDDLRQLMLECQSPGAMVALCTVSSSL